MRGYAKCPLCGSDVEFTITKYYPATYWSPAEGGDIEDIIPECDCVEHPCVDEAKYYFAIATDIKENRRVLTAEDYL